jgi:hypothetical protein
LVDGDLVELRGRYRTERLERESTVVTHVDRAVVPDHQVVAVRGVDPHVMVIDVHETHARQGCEGPAPILRSRDCATAGIDHVLVVRIDSDEAVIHGPVVFIAAELPTAALVVRAPHTATLGVPGPVILSGRILVRGHFDQGVDDIGVRAGHVQTDAPHGACRETVAGQACPVRPSVFRLPYAAARTAAVETPIRTSTLIGCCVENLWVRWIHNEVGRTGVVVHEEHVVPGASAVARFQHSALRVGTEELADCGDIDDVRISRMHDDAVDALRLTQAHVRK